MILNKKLMYNALPKNMHGIKKMGNKNKIRLARRPDELYRRTFFYSSFLGEDGYLTIESALVIPVFIFIVITMIYFFVILCTDMEIYRAMKDSSGDIGYIEALLTPDSDVAGRDLAIKSSITKNLGNKFFNNKVIKGGIMGIDVSDSTYDKNSGVLDIVVSYQYKLPYSFFEMLDVKRTQRFKSRLYTGKNIYAEKEDEDPYVYVTKNGKVYHVDRNCSYLNFNITTTTWDLIDNCRNKWGEKYYPCENCMKNVDEGTGTGELYITEDGNRYHGSLECYSLSRDVYVKKLSEVEGMKPCSRCGGADDK